MNEFATRCKWKIVAGTTRRNYTLCNNVFNLYIVHLLLIIFFLPNFDFLFWLKIYAVARKLANKLFFHQKEDYVYAYTCILVCDDVIMSLYSSPICFSKFWLIVMVWNRLLSLAERWQINSSFTMWFSEFSK